MRLFRSTKRLNIALVADVRLNFVTRAQAERDVRFDLPIVLNEQSCIHLIYVDKWISGRNRVLRRAAAIRDDGGERLMHGDSIQHR